MTSTPIPARPARRLLGTALAATLLLSACGGGDSGSGGETSGEGAQPGGPLTFATGGTGGVYYPYGGGIANYLATQLPELAAAVPFYGAQPPAAEVAKIRTPLLIHDAGKDERILAGWPAYEEALKENKVPYQHFVYPGVEHGFNNDTTPRYDEAAAKLAWGRTMAFFKEKLG